MKVLRPRHRLLFSSAIVIIIFTFIIFSKFAPVVLLTYRSYWIFLFALLLVIFTPLGQKKLITPDKKFPKQKLFSWYSQIFLLELSLLFIYWGLCQLSGIVLPLYTSTNHLFIPSLTHIVKETGGFPWTAIALSAALFGFYAYHQKKDAYFSTLFHGFLKTTATNTLGIMINTTLRAATLFAITLMMMITVLLMITALTSTATVTSLAGTGINSLMVYTLLLVLAYSKFAKKIIHAFSTKKQIPLSLILVVIVLLVSALMLLLTLFFGSHQTKIISAPAIVTGLLKTPWIYHWHIFSTLWWLACTPLTAIVIAKLSRGYSLRSMMLATLAFPLLLSISLEWHPLLQILAKIPLVSPIFSALISLAALTVFLTLISKTLSTTALSQTYLSYEEKYRASDRFIDTLFKFLIIFICVYLATGILFLSLMFFMCLLILSVALLFLPITIIQELCRR